MKRTLPHFNPNQNIFRASFMLALLFLGRCAAAQSYLPYYSLTPSISTYTPVSSGTLIDAGAAISDNDYFGYAIGFPFNFNGTTYSTFSLNANGVLVFGSSYSSVSSTGAMFDYYSANNALIPLNVDLQGTATAEIRFDNFGTAPNRTLVVQWSNFGIWGSAGDTTNFQVVLHETTNLIEFNYGVFTKGTSDHYARVGIRGASTADVLNRATTSDWATTTTGSSIYDYCLLSSYGPVLPYEGLTFAYAPPPLSFVSSDVAAASTQTTAPGSLNQQMLRFTVQSYGMSGYLPVSEIVVNTAGTTAAGDIANLKVFYTGTSNRFATDMQFGSTASSPGASNTVTDSVNLLQGTNYFWVTYDIAPGAVAGNVVNAGVSSVRVKGVNRAPSLVSAPGSRQIAPPMSYISSEATQTFVQKIGKGTRDNQVLGLRVITSSTGAPVNISRLDFNINGTTDPSNVLNMKVWYTGNNSSFAMGTPFGNAVPAMTGVLAYSVTGNQELLNDTNHFWITYDIDTASVLGNLIDGECTSVTVDGISRIPSVTAPAGSREVREDYCPPVISNPVNSCNYNYYISSVYTSGAVTDLFNTSSGCNGNPVNNYIYYGNSKLVVNQNQAFTINLGNYNTYQTYAVWIDYNQDGIFDNVTERVFQSPNTGNSGYVNGYITIPCSALPGETRMRIRSAEYWWANAFIVNSCDDVGYGETEDYTVEIRANPVTYDDSKAVQQTGIAAPGTVDLAVLRVDVSASQCGVPAVSAFVFSTSGSTNPADIVRARLYKTGTSDVFSTAVLLGTVAAPSGRFTFSVTDTLITNGTTYYWLAYDISAGATLANAVDATFDSIEVLGAYHTPVVADPPGEITITAPMSYVSSEATQAVIQKVGRGTRDNQVLGLRLITSSAGAPVNASQIDFNINGTTDPANVLNVKIWYTGNSNRFAMRTLFGSPVPVVPGVLAYSVTGSQQLLNDTNYFWITYDIDSAAALGNVVDGECTSVTVDGTARIPSVTMPAGSREIREDYCAPVVSNALSTCRNNSYINSVYTSGAVHDLSNSYSGCNGNPVNNYIHYADIPFVVKQNQPISINLGDYYTYMTYSVWIDYNQDGVFDNATERVFQSPGVGNYGYVSGGFTIPCSALPGETRMRVRGANYWWSSNFIPNACDDVGEGETEDYTVTILENPMVFMSNADQHADSVAPGTVNKLLLNIPVYAAGCGDGVATSFRFSTAGSTIPADIANATLYKTGRSSVFSTAVPVATIASPSGQFTFSVTDTLNANDVTHYWLTYDVSSSAIIGNVLDATLDSIEISGAYTVPANGNPAGNLAITLPMSYVGAEATQTFVQKVGKGTVENQVVGLRLITSSTGAVVRATQLDFNINGTTNPSDVVNMQVWYTGNSSKFRAKTQFGNNVAYIPGTLNYSVTGDQELVNDTNYFWITYDIDAGATLGNLVDGECTSITVAGTAHIPSITAPAGSREIREEYCPPLVSNAVNSCYGSYINTVYTTGAVSNLSNFYSGCSNNPVNNYINYQDQSLVVRQNETFNLVMGDYNTYLTYAVWIDYNQDGMFDNITERVFGSSATGNYGTASGSITIPCTALPGQTRMRIRGADYWWRGSFIPNSCDDVGYGETEDYTVEILANPVAYDNSTSEQQAGIVAPGTADIPVLRVPVFASKCGAALATTFVFSTTGSTSATDIVQARLYKTGASSVFNTSTLVGTVAAPAGQFTFTVADTLNSGMVTNYWLTYTVSSSAVVSHVLDATFDSIEVLGAYHVPDVTNPAGELTIAAPMAYLGSEVTQTYVQSVGRGTQDNPVIGLRVVTTSTGAPVYVNQLDFAVTGTTDTSNIRNMKAWYTGSNNMFGMYAQYGSTLDFLPGTLTFSITGRQPLANDTSYFWLTYDVDTASAIGNFIDGECASVTIDGTARIPVITAPAGSREIRDEYCPPLASQAATSCSNNYYISSFYTSGAVTDIWNTNSGCNGNPVNNYIYYRNQTLVAKQNQAITLNMGNYNTYLTYTVWIDYNQDGEFDNVTERVFDPPYAGNVGYTNGSITIPCSALPGQTRMRVRGGNYWWNGTLIANACDDVGYGETEDYNVMILANPAVYDDSRAIQQTGIVAPGTVDLPVLRVDVSASQCGVPVASAFTFSTAGSTNAADIVSAKLYKTGTSAAFNTLTLLGTVAAPSGRFTFPVIDTLVANGTAYYWLAYDISAGATLTHAVDAIFDSVEVLGSYHTPSVTDPSGYITITAPMTYVSSEATQTVVQKVGRGTQDNQVLGLRLITSSTGAPVNITQLDFNISGTTDPADVQRMKVWYTGNNSQFGLYALFGNTVTAVPGMLAYSVTGNMELLNDTNYFWITYDIDSAAALGNVVDGECTSVTVDGTSQVPTVTAPAGSREIRDDYCTPVISNGASSCSRGTYISTVYTTGAVSNLSNYYSGCNGNPANNYIKYSRQMVAYQNRTISINLGDYNTYLTYAVWIDYNQDGVFDNATERVFQSPYIGNYGFVNGSFQIPATANIGQTRMRIRGGDYWWSGNFISDACADVGYGETEDYDVVILPEPAPATYVWNRTTADDFNTSANWTPARDYVLPNDKLMFNGGGQVTVYNVSYQGVSSIIVDNATEVMLESYYPVTLSAIDTLALISGKIVPGTNVTLSVGADTSKVGTVIGTGSVQGLLKRWINTTVTSYDFPLSDNGYNNTVNLTFTTMPAKGGSITARHIPGNPGVSGLPLVDGGITINTAADLGIWKLKAGDGFAGGAYTGTFTADGITAVNNPAGLSLMRRVAGIGFWTLHGTPVTTTGTTSVPVLSRTGMTLLGEFGIGGDAAVNPIPVELTTFKANALKGDVLTSWRTASELNNAGFDVQRSVDGKTFATAGFVQGKGNSTMPASYSYTDADAFKAAGAATLYYRLRQVDMDGKEWISAVVTVAQNDNRLQGVTVYPNPFNSSLTLDLVSTDDAAYAIVIMDIQGKVVFTSERKVTRGLNKMELNGLDELKAGIYFLTMKGPEAKTIKLVKTN